MAKTEYHSFRAADPNSNYRSDVHVFGPNQDIAYDIQLKGAFKSNGGQENRVESTKDYSNGILNQGFNEKIRKYSELAKVSNVSFVPLIFLDFNECMTSDQETDNDVASINLKDNGDDADDDDDDDVDPDYDDDDDYDDG